LEEQQLAKLRA